MAYKIADGEPEFRLDIEAINKKYAKRKDDPRRCFTASFHVPYDCEFDSGHFKSIAKERCERFIEAMKKKGWDLISKIRVFEGEDAYNIDSNVKLIEKKNHRVAGIFQMASTPTPLVLEIPEGLTKTGN